jgi:hypothetical protein
MTIGFPDSIANALNAKAAELGIHPQALAFNLLRRGLGLPERDYEPRDEWERELRKLATDCGVSPPDEALSREALYD